MFEVGFEAERTHVRRALRRAGEQRAADANGVAKRDQRAEEPTEAANELVPSGNERRCLAGKNQLARACTLRRYERLRNRLVAEPEPISIIFGQIRELQRNGSYLSEHGGESMLSSRMHGQEPPPFPFQDPDRPL